MIGVRGKKKLEGNFSKTFREKKIRKTRIGVGKFNFE